MTQFTTQQAVVKLQYWTRFMLLVLAFVLFLILGWKYFVPFGTLNITYDVKHGSPYVSNFASKETVRLFGSPNSKKGDQQYFQSITKSPLYFDVKVPRAFQSATVTLRYQNPNSQPRLRLGVQQKGENSYSYRDLAFVEPVLDAMPPEWDRIQEGNIVLWQKNNDLLKLKKKRKEQIQQELKTYDAEQEGQWYNAHEKYNQGLLTSYDIGKLEQRQIYERSVTLAELEDRYSVQPSERPAPVFKSIGDFLQSQPNQKTTELYNYSLPPRIDLADYVPAEKPTIIQASLRGSHSIKTLVGTNEKLRFVFTIQDINRHVGKDDCTVQLWLDDRKIEEQSVKKLGTIFASGDPSDEQTITLEKSGLLPGSYTVKIIANDDIFIKRIETAQHQVKFAGQIYLTDNEEYRALLGDKPLAPTHLVTDGSWVSALTSHASSLQTLAFDGKKLQISDVQQAITTHGLKGVTEITVPENDVLLNSDGYFAFSEDQLYTDLEPYKTFDSSTDLATIDNILAEYPQAKTVGDWLEATATIQGPALYVKDKSLRFIIDAPGLSENHRMLNVRSVRIELHKQPWTFSKIWNKVRSQLLRG